MNFDSKFFQWLFIGLAVLLSAFALFGGAFEKDPPESPPSVEFAAEADPVLSEYVVPVPVAARALSADKDSGGSPNPAPGPISEPGPPKLIRGYTYGEWIVAVQVRYKKALAGRPDIVVEKPIFGIIDHKGTGELPNAAALKETKIQNKGIPTDAEVLSVQKWLNRYKFKPVTPKEETPTGPPVKDK